MRLFGHLDGHQSSEECVCVCVGAAPQVSALLWACCEAEHVLPSELANDLSKVAATRFASVPPAELADLLFSFAR